MFASQRNKSLTTMLIAGAVFGSLSVAAQDKAAAPQQMSAGFITVDSRVNTADPMVGGHQMYASKDIMDNAMNSADHTTLITAIKAAGLVETFKGTGPFTVFAPTNEAFANLPAGTVDALLKHDNRETLSNILIYHVVSGSLSMADLDKQIKAGNGSAELKSIGGGTLIATRQGADIVLEDEKGNLSRVSIPDVFQSNGVIHVVDSVLQPN
jgi:uncharacterized surface protein with fasciclin (FAS1) repeats